MAFNTSVTTADLNRANIWTGEIKDILEDELMGQGWVRWIDFPDGTTLNIPSIGQATVQDLVEDQSILYEAMDTGNFTFTINEYIGSGMYITDKAKMDSFYAQELINSFVPKQSRAIMEHVETEIMALQGAQTVSNPNQINGADHRFVGSGTNETMATEDFAKAKYALRKANVRLDNLVAIVDPSVAYALETATNLVNVSNNPRWEGIIETGLTSSSTGMRFIKNIFGFDVYESNYLAAGNGGDETIGGVQAASNKANMLFSASADVLPFIGAWRQMPNVEFNRNVPMQRDEYTTTAYYDTALYRPENLVCILTDDDQV